MSRGQIYRNVKSAPVRKSAFDLSYAKLLTCEMGQLIPVMCDECIPGDLWQIAQTAVVRMMPIVAPILHDVRLTLHTFFVPYRLLWPETVVEEVKYGWEQFITGGVDGNDAQTPPTWEPTDTSVGSLWDYLGFPTGIDPDGAYPLDFPRRAYNAVYNNYYRDPTLMDEVGLDNEKVLNRCWTKDYFTSSLITQQRGTAPSLPISGTTSAVWDSATIINDTIGANVGVAASAAEAKLRVNNAQGAQNALNAFNANTVDLSIASTFDIADLRLAFQTQRWLERNNRVGPRYIEQLYGHYGTAPRDERLQRPEYVGGIKAPLIISEVLQTSSTDVTSPQGNLAGHGIAVGEGFVGKYFVREHGLMMTIMSIMPKPAYSQGINRQWLRSTRYDFPFPEFANLSEQAIINAEICATANAVHNQTIFGYQGRYDECRTKSDQVCGLMRTTFNYWHLGREFDTGAPPSLNDEFVECVPRKDIFAAESEPGLVVQIGNRLRVVRCLPYIAEPGLIDHN